ETSWRAPLLAAVELARKLGAQLHVLTVRCARLRHGRSRFRERTQSSNRSQRSASEDPRRAWREHLCRDPQARRGSRRRTDRCCVGPPHHEELSARMRHGSCAAPIARWPASECTGRSPPLRVGCRWHWILTTAKDRHPVFAWKAGREHSLEL